MFANEFNLVIRNLLLVQLLVIITIPSQRVSVYQDLLRIWKRLNIIPMLTRSLARTKKQRNKFWEIDMTKFEP